MVLLITRVKKAREENECFNSCFSEQCFHQEALIFTISPRRSLSSTPGWVKEKWYRSWTSALLDGYFLEQGKEFGCAYGTYDAWPFDIKRCQAMYLKQIMRIAWEPSREWQKGLSVDGETLAMHASSKSKTKAELNSWQSTCASWREHVKRSVNNV